MRIATTWLEKLPSVGPVPWVPVPIAPPSAWTSTSPWFASPSPWARSGSPRSQIFVPARIVARPSAGSQDSIPVQSASESSTPSVATTGLKE